MCVPRVAHQLAVGKNEKGKHKLTLMAATPIIFFHHHIGHSIEFIAFINSFLIGSFEQPANCHSKKSVVFSLFSLFSVSIESTFFLLFNFIDCNNYVSLISVDMSNIFFLSSNRKPYARKQIEEKNFNSTRNNKHVHVQFTQIYRTMLLIVFY